MAQERKKRRIVLASVLKPVDDTRMFEKMGQTLARDDQNDVHIIGFKGTKSGYEVSGINLIELNPFPRISFARWLAKWKVFFTILRLNPDILIITTHELLLPGVLLRLIHTHRLIYDIRENYYRNILYSGSFPGIVRQIVASLVRLKEIILAPFVDHFLLAEKGYEQEFAFFKKSFTVIENKAVTTSHEKQRNSTGSIRLLFSGTLAESTGVFYAIELAKELHKRDSRITLTIIGKASLKDTLNRLQKAGGSFHFIKLIGGDDLVSHEEIVRLTHESDFGILSYPLLHHTKNSKPTKLFEYLNAALPIILEKQWPWIDEYKELEPFILTDFTSPHYDSILDQIRNKTFYTSKPQNVTWSSEEKAFTDAVAG